MPAVSPFRALRYDEDEAGPLAELIAPPYDVIDDELRLEYLRRSPYNVVHLTLPDSPEAAGSTLAGWRERGVLREDEPALWWLAQDYVGPDGVARSREGLGGSVEATPYTAGQVLPHERTHVGPREGRLRLLQATRTQLEPIFLIYDDDAPVGRPGDDPEVDVEEGGVRTRAWRLPPDELRIDTPLLIADGHHRYETAVAYREQDPAATHLFAVLVSSRAPGLEIFPTHRIARSLGVAPFGLKTPTWDTSSLSLYRDGTFFRLDAHDELDAREIEQYGLEGVSYTPDAERAIAAVDDGEAEAAFLLRAPTLAQVAELAARGETMPQKSTFFYPKLTSGLFLHPV